MIIESFDNQSEAIINPPVKEDAVVVDACIVTFSHVIEKFVFYKTYIGAPACVGTIEDTLNVIRTAAYRDEGTSYHYAPKWDTRTVEGQTEHTQHDAGHFDIAIALAEYVANREG